MSHHGDFTKSEWAQLLRDTRRLIGGAIHFREGYEFVGEIKKVEDLEGAVRFHLTWCGRKTQAGWTRRERRFVTRPKVRFELSDSPNKIAFGDSCIRLADQILVRESDLIAPITHAQRRAMREAKKHELPATSPDLPLFTAR